MDETFIKIISDNDIFLNNILSAWINVQESFNTNKTKLIAKTIIWNYKDITQNGKTYFYNKWYEKGIMYLEHLFDYRTKTFYDFNFFSGLYDINQTEYFKYFQIICSIPTEMKKELTENGINLTQPQKLSTKINTTNKVNALMYNQLQVKPEKTYIRNKIGAYISK